MSDILSRSREERRQNYERKMETIKKRREEEEKRKKAEDPGGQNLLGNIMKAQSSFLAKVKLKGVSV